jgi:hypothetical protein
MSLLMSVQYHFESPSSEVSQLPKLSSDLHIHSTRHELS